jgi:hypothetical protein
MGAAAGQVIIGLGGGGHRVVMSVDDLMSGYK